MTARPSRIELVLASAIFLIHLAVSFQGLGELFLNGHQGYNGAFRAGFARHYLEHGLIATRGRPLKNPHRVTDPARGKVHWHHPPLVNVLVAGSIALFGESEAAARTVPVAAGLASFWLIYLLVRRRYGAAPALVSSAIFAALPMQVEYGQMVNYEPLVVCFSLAVLFFLERLRHGSGGWANYVGLTLAAILSCSTDWPGFLFCAVICICAVACRPRKLVAAILVGIVGVGLAIFWWWWLDSASGHQSLAWLAEFRMGTDKKGLFVQLWGKTKMRLGSYFGWLPVVTAVLWIVYEAVRRKRLDPIVAVFLPCTTLYIVVFRQGAIHHSYNMYYLVPAVAVAAGAGAVELTSIAREGRRWLERRTSRAEREGVGAGRLSRALLWASRPILLTLVLGLAWGGWFAITDWLALETIRPVSYRIGSHKPEARPKMPYVGGLHYALLGQLVNSMSEPTDLVIMHRKSVNSVQFHYYLWRRVRRVGTVRHLGRGDWLVVPERLVDLPTQASLVGKYPVVRTLKHLICDLEPRQTVPAVRQLDFVSAPANWWWSYSRSLIYPPYRLVENQSAAETYLRRLVSDSQNAVGSIRTTRLIPTNHR